MSIEIYEQEVREIGRFKNQWGEEYIIINQTYWYSTDNYTQEEAIKAYKKQKGIA